MAPPGDDLFLRINSFARSTPWLHDPAAAYATYGVLVFAALLVIAWWIARGRDERTMAVALLTPIAILVAFVVQQLLVLLVDEPRPYAVHPDALILIARTTDPSFPSDHACVVGAATVGLFLVSRRLGWVALALAVLMAATRVYVGAHWPLDVVAGLVLGAVVAYAVIGLLRGPVARLVERIRDTRLRALVAADRPTVSRWGRTSRPG